MQCAIPAFDGLFPEPYNSAILKLLFLCAHWHALAKLRSHTDPTLDIFDNVTVKSATAFRHFANNICVHFDTRELAREEGQRKCREAKRKSRSSQDNTADTQPTPLHEDLPTSSDATHIAPPHHNIAASSGINRTSPCVAGFPAAHHSMPSLSVENPTPADVAPQILLASDPKETPHIIPPSASGTERNPAPSVPKFSGTSGRKKNFTLNTYKYHACGDYPNTIRRYGTTDSYSTEIVSYRPSCMLFSLHFTFRVSLNTRRPRLGTSGRIESSSLSRSQLLNAVKPV
jgi:hypothetical protein